ncbi:MAG: hypothetical protein U0869_21150 [Chloroflexota bacterium]
MALAAGSVLAVALVPPALATRPAAVAPAATVTGAASCPGVGFMPTGSGVQLSEDGVARYFTGFAATFRCPIQLPQGARVTAVRFSVNDGRPGTSAEFSITDCQLQRGAIDPASSTVVTMAGPLSSGDQPGKVVLSDTSITGATVDNRRYAYWAQCSIGGTDVAAVPVYLYGVDIRYTVPA